MNTSRHQIARQNMARPEVTGKKTGRRLLDYQALRQRGIPWSRVHIARLEAAGKFPCTSISARARSLGSRTRSTISWKRKRLSASSAKLHEIEPGAAVERRPGSVFTASENATNHDEQSHLDDEHASDTANHAGRESSRGARPALRCGVDAGQVLRGTA